MKQGASGARARTRFAIAACSCALALALMSCGDVPAEGPATTPCNSEAVLSLDEDGDGVPALWVDHCGALTPLDPEVVPGQNADCDDGDATRHRRVWKDGDGDGATVGEAECVGDVPGGYSEVRSTEDCDDTDSNVYPGQLQYFTIGRNSDDEFDYNCDNMVEPSGPTMAAANPCLLLGCPSGSFWQGLVPPDCGRTGNIVQCSSVAGLCLAAQVQLTTRACR